MSLDDATEGAAKELLKAVAKLVASGIGSYPPGEFQVINQAIADGATLQLHVTVGTKQPASIHCVMHYAQNEPLELFGLELERQTVN